MKRKILCSILTVILLCTFLTYFNVSHASENHGYISLSFDDGILSQYTTVFPLLEQYGMVGTFYIPTGTGPVGSIAPDGLTQNVVNQIPVCNLQQMQSAGMEIGSHSVSHNDMSSNPANGHPLTDSQLNYEFSQSKATLESWGLNIYDFAYPYGVCDLSHADTIAQQYYASTRTVQWNSVLGPVSLPTSEFELSSWDAEYQPGNGAYSSVLPTDESYINYAINNNLWIVFYMHNIIGTLTGDCPSVDQALAQAYGGITISDFTTLLQYIQCSGIQVLTVHQALTQGLSVSPTLTIDPPIVTPNPTSAPTPNPTMPPLSAPTPTPTATPTPAPYVMTPQDWQNFWAWFLQQPQTHYASQTKQANYENKLLTQWKTQNGFT